MGSWRHRIIAASLAAILPGGIIWGGPTSRGSKTPVPTTPPLRLASREKPLIPANQEEVVAAEPAVDASGCEDGNCPPYYRNRPRHCQQNRIKLYNRSSEPDWYHYYRCEHFGYHPTQWHAWPEGWLNCRHPQPGDHPYDIERPKPDKRILDRERRLEENRAEPGLLDEPLPPRNSEQPPPSPGVKDSPRELPPPQGTTPAPETTPMPPEKPPTP